MIVCKHCGGNNILRGKVRITNGTYQVRDMCLNCGRNANGNGINVSHKFVEDLDALPLLADYLIEYGEPCAVCGSNLGSELNHWAPRHLFGKEADLWPTDYLCKIHHDQWHKIVTPEMYKRNGENA